MTIEYTVCTEIFKLHFMIHIYFYDFILFFSVFIHTEVQHINSIEVPR